MIPGQLCPWCGVPCECEGFPYLENDLVPVACEEKIRTMPALIPLRKVATKPRKPK